MVGADGAGLRVEVVDQAHLERGGEGVWHDTSFAFLPWPVGWGRVCI